MALIECFECKASISDRAAACPSCGAPLHAPVGNAIPVVIREEKKFKWWLWLPAGAVGAFLLFGALIPKNVADANSFGRACRSIAGSNGAALLDCEREEARIRYGQQNSEPPPVNTSFVAEPPRTPASATNEEIMRSVIAPSPKKPQRSTAATHAPPTPGKAP